MQLFKEPVLSQQKVVDSGHRASERIRVVVYNGLRGAENS